MDKIISNIEGLRNPTILQQLEAMRKYIIENAKQGAPGVQGIFTANAEYNPDTQYYPITSVRNYVADAFIGQPIYFNNGYIAIVAQVYDSTPTASPAFTVNNVRDLRGATIVRVENTGYTDGDGFTITHCEVELNNGQIEHFDVQAKKGADGASVINSRTLYEQETEGFTESTVQLEFSNGNVSNFNVRAKNGEPAPVVAITDVPPSATQGAITIEQLQTLQSYDLAAILFNSEIYYPMDKMSSEGYYTYVHNGYDNTGNAFAEKVIVITLSTRGWVLLVKRQKAPPPDIGLHHIQFFGEPEPKDIWPGTSWEIDTAMQGRVPIGSGGSYVFGATGGSPDAVLVEHGDHLYASNGEWLDHGNAPGAFLSSMNNYGTGGRGWNIYGSNEFYPAGEKVGVDGTGKNMPPYIVANYWKRTA